VWPVLRRPVPPGAVSVPPGAVSVPPGAVSADDQRGITGNDGRAEVIVVEGEAERHLAYRARP